MFVYLAWWISSRLCFYCFWVPYLSPLPPDTCFFRHSCAPLWECLKKINQAVTQPLIHAADLLLIFCSVITAKCPVAPQKLMAVIPYGCGTIMSRAIILFSNHCAMITSCCRQLIYHCLGCTTWMFSLIGISVFNVICWGTNGRKPY